jgi:hypothetical protein
VEDTRINDPERNWDENRSRRWEFREKRGADSDTFPFMST